MNIFQERNMNKYARIDAIEQIDVLQYVRILDGIGHINILSTKCRNGVTKRPFTSQTFRFVTSSYENSLPRAASGKGTKRLLKVTDLLSCSISFHLLSSTQHSHHSRTPLRQTQHTSSALYNHTQYQRSYNHYSHQR
jgi:hypothetical protein